MSQLLDKVKSYWWAWGVGVALIGGLVGFGAQIKAIAMAPERIEQAREESYEQISKTNEAIERLTDSQMEYFMAQKIHQERQEAVNEQTKTWLEILTAKLLRDNE